MRLDIIKHNQMEWQLLGHTVLINNSLENFEYELADKVKKGYYEFPIIKEREIALNRIIEEYVSMCRFGDGEFEVLFGMWFENRNIRRK